MSDGVLVDDAIEWTEIRLPTWTSPAFSANLGKYNARVWRESSMWLGWRGRVSEDGRHGDVSRTRSYRTEEAAMLATGERLRKVAEQ